MRQQNKKSKFVALLLSLLLVCTMMPQLAWATGALSVGTGTADDPYQISNTDDLKAFRDKVNGGERTACAILTQNIDLKGETWMPFHFPDGNCNWLTHAALDPICRIPEYKVCAIKVEKIK